MNRLGRHIVVEFYECPQHILNDVSYIEQSMLNAAKEAGATIINSTFHHFSPFGVSGVVVIQESHLAIHTWPEFGYVALDVFTCGESVNPWTCYRFLEKAFESGHGSAIEMGRGQIELLKKAELTVHPDTPEIAQSIVPEFTRNIWFTERGEDVALSLRHTGEILYRKTSPYQRVEVIDTFAYGKMLTLDGMVMTTEKDEYIYHEMITHVPALTHPNPKRVLVIGGGDGGAVRELVKHDSIEQVDLVEIDPLVIEASQLHLPTIASFIKHPKVNLLVEDGIRFVENSKNNSYDIVIVDSTDPVGPAEGLFTPTFYNHVYRILNENGIMITQSESPRFKVKVFQEIYACYRQIFGYDNVHCYIVAIPTYPSGTWSLAFCSKGSVHPIKNFDYQRSKSFCSQHSLNYYNEDLHTAAFVLPNYVKQLLAHAR